MIAKAEPISHGANAMLYATKKENSDIVKVHGMPADIAPETMWQRMVAHQKFYEWKRSSRKEMTESCIRFELSPENIYTKDFSLSDWAKLADDFIREYDKTWRLLKGKKNKGKSNAIANTQYVVTLHRDSKGGILHLHIDANRIDLNGDLIDTSFSRKRAVAAANKVTELRGWTQAKIRGEENKKTISQACQAVLRQMPEFSWNSYVKGLKAYGYEVYLVKSKDGKVCGYNVKKGNSQYKASQLGVGREFMASKIETTWLRCHPEAVQSQNSPIKRIAHHRLTMEVADISQAITPRQHIEMQEYHYMIDNKDLYLEIPADINCLMENQLSTSTDESVATLKQMQHIAVLLFTGYLDAATSMATSSGGGGGGTESSWGRDKDEDEHEWAIRCAHMAIQLCKPKRKRGFRR